MGTFPDVFTPFHRLKYTIVKMRNRQSISCQRRPPTFFRPEDLWSSKTFLLEFKNKKNNNTKHHISVGVNSFLSTISRKLCYSHLHALTCKIPLLETWRNLSRWYCPSQSSWCSRACSTRCHSLSRVRCWRRRSRSRRAPRRWWCCSKRTHTARWRRWRILYLRESWNWAWPTRSLSLDTFSP